MPTYTTNLGLKVPVVGSDTNNWGDFLNSDLSYLDNIFEVSGTSISLLIGNQPINTPTATGQTTFTLDQIRLKDDRTIEFGTGIDYWMRYTDTGTRFEFTSTNVNPAGDDGVIFYVVDGTDDAIFTGEVEASQLLGLTVKLKDTAGGEYVGLDAPSTVSGTYTLTFPAAVGAVDQVLSLNNIDGTLQWATPEVGDITSVVAGIGLSGGGDGPGAVTLNVEATQTQITSVGALIAGSIGSAFGAIDVGSSAISGGAGTFSSVTVGSGASGTTSSAIVNVRDFLGLYDADASHYVSIQALDVTTASYTITLPAGVGSSGQVLENQGSGTLEWVDPTTGDVESVNGTSTGGITATNGGGPAVTLALDFDTSAMSPGDITVADDSFAFLNATSGNVERETIADLMTAVAGTGITATSGVLAIDSTVATLSGSQTLTNKTLTTPVIASISNTGTLTLPTSTDTLVGRATTDTLTNKMMASGSVWQAGTIGEGYGGTGQTTYAEGDILYGDDATGLLRLAAGTNTHVLTLAGGVPTWAAPATATADASTLTGTTLNSPVVTSSLTTVGILDGGSITSGFGEINIGTDQISTSGTIYGGDIVAQSGNDLVLQDDDASHAVKLTAPSATATYTLTFPSAVGSSGQVLQTSDASGTLAWVTPDAGDIAGVTAGTGLSGGGTSGTVTLNVDASQTQITSVGDLDAGSITSNFGSVNTGSSTITTTGTVGAGTISLASAGKCYLDGGSNTYIYENGADQISFVTGGTEMMQIMAPGDTEIDFKENDLIHVGDVYLDTLFSDVTGASGTAIVVKGVNHTGATELADCVDQGAMFIQSKTGSSGGLAIGVRSDSEPYIEGTFADASGGRALHINKYSGAGVYFTAVVCSGAMSKGSGSFRIPHPLPDKYDTHDLVHSFVEGPRADLIYRGSVALSGGSASVDLDEEVGLTDGTWELLCRDPQVFLQNEDGWSALKGSVSGSTLIISCEDTNSTDTISWMVVAERQDDHMKDPSIDWTDDDGRPILEPLKRDNDDR